MPSCKSDFTLTVTVRGKSFSIGAVELPNGKFAIKRGRSWSSKMPLSTPTEIFNASRVWAVKQLRAC